MNPSAWEQAARQVLAELEASDALRRRRIIRPIDATHALCNGRTCLNFASNNYLGLSHHPRVIAAAQQSLRLGGIGAGASALITGYGPEHQSAERHLARWKKTESAVLLPSGYQANHAAVQTLAALAQKQGRGVRFLLDKLSHASLIDAVRATGFPFRVFPHNGLPKLARLLAEAPADELQVVLTESIFSMDGDAADLVGLAELKAKHSFLLVLDEAHASGVYGPAGSGLAAEAGLGGVADLTVITLSKSLGCGGGAVCGSQGLCDALVNLARAYIYSTSLAPAMAAAADAGLAVMESEPQHQERLRQISRQTREELARTGWRLPPGDSPIIPLVLGAESAALAAADFLLSRGILALAIRPPTVPRQTSRLRITLSAGHSDEDLAQLRAAIGELSEMRNAAC